MPEAVIVFVSWWGSGEEERGEEEGDANESAVLSVVGVWESLERCVCTQQEMCESPRGQRSFSMGRVSYKKQKTGFYLTT
jgi:hypothetical protein